MQQHQNLPTILPSTYDDGWNDSDVSERLIQGNLLKCIDGVWTVGGMPAPKQLLALSTVTAVQLWKEKKPVQTIVKRPGEPWPKLDDLNAEIPEEDWEIGLDGKPREPWQRQFVVYLLDPDTAAIYTFANGTAGASQAVQNLKDAVKWQRALRGDHVVPLVELQNRPMPVPKLGVIKLRPHFHPVEWRNLDIGFTPMANAASQLELTPPDGDVPFDDKLSDLAS